MAFKSHSRQNRISNKLSRISNKLSLLWLALILTTLIGIIGLLFSERNHLLDFVKAENVRQKHHFSNFLKVHGETLRMLVFDYTFWDEMVDFTKTRDKNWAEDNLDTALDTYRADYIWVYDADHRILHSTKQAGLPQLGLPLQRDEIKSNLLRKKKFDHFFLRVKQGALEVRAATIHPSDDPERTSRPQGFFYAARLWNKENLESFSRLLDGTRTFLLEPDKEPPMNLRNRTIISQVLNGRNGKPEARLIVVYEHPYVEQFQRRAAYEIALATLIGIVILAMAIISTRRWVKAPLSKLSRSLREENESYLEDLKHQNDEMGQLARLTGEFFEQRRSLERKVEERTHEVRRAKDLSDALNNIDAAMNSALDFEAILGKVTRMASEAIQCDASALFLHADSYWALAHPWGLPKDMTGTKIATEDNKYPALAIQAQAPIIVKQGDPIFPEQFIKWGIFSILSVPLLLKRGAFGVLDFYRFNDAKMFDDAQIDFARKLATSLALSLENSRFLKEERNIANTLQKAFLTTPKGLPGVEYKAIYVAAGEAQVGGDFYEIMELADNSIGIIIGDVSGKGLPAATLTALIKNTIKAYAFDGEAPASVIAKTNRVILEATAPGAYASVFFAVLSTRDNRLVYCSAGHPDAIIKRNKEKPLLLSTGSPVVGALVEGQFRENEHDFSRDDILILYTDGVTEARRGRQFFGEDRLIALVEEIDMPIGDIPSAILKEVKEFSGNQLRDDIAILALNLKA